MVIVVQVRMTVIVLLTILVNVHAIRECNQMIFVVSCFVSSLVVKFDNRIVTLEGE